jgi:hypothetical protein
MNTRILEYLNFELRIVNLSIILHSSFVIRLFDYSVYNSYA